MIVRSCICFVVVLTFLAVFSIQSVESKPSTDLQRCRPGAMYCNPQKGKRSHFRKKLDNLGRVDERMAKEDETYLDLDSLEF
ncbi:hypothetical protein ACROYT_G033376 [Oculina patagonica]